MSQYITSDVVEIKFEGKSFLGITLSKQDDKTYYYKQETYVTGTPNNYTYETSILRSEDASFDVTTVIGTRGPTGTITLDDDFANEDEKKYLVKTLIPGLKTSSENLNTKVNAQLGLTSGDENRLLARLGLQANINNTEEGVKLADTVVSLSEGTQTINDIEIKGRNFRKQYAHFSYPEDLASNKQDRIKFTQKYTEGTKIDTNLKAQKAFQRKVKKVRGSVTLPIVTGIEDTNRVDWQGQNLNPLQSIGAAIATDVFQDTKSGGDFNSAITRLGGIFNEAKNVATTQAGSDIQSAINVYLAQQAVGAQGLLSRTTGAIANPNLEMLFTGPQLRSFAFQFTLSPRDASEADQVRKIIRFFKQGMSVKTSSSNVFLKAPNIFDIQYQTFNTGNALIEHPSINMIKTCALTNCNVRYTPNNTYMTYEDPFRTMQSYQLTLSFGELDPIYDSDYTQLDKDRDQVIGY